MSVGFDWDAANIRHIGRHHVRPSEAEEAMADLMQTSAGEGEIGGEYPQAILGMTKTGRILFIVYTERNGTYRVLQARAANRFEQEDYQEQSR